MRKAIRQNEILELLNKYNYVTVEFLSNTLHTSPSSIRRDLGTQGDGPVVSLTKQKQSSIRMTVFLWQGQSAASHIHNILSIIINTASFAI